MSWIVIAEDMGRKVVLCGREVEYVGWAAYTALETLLTWERDLMEAGIPISSGVARFPTQEEANAAAIALQISETPRDKCWVEELTGAHCAPPDNVPGKTDFFRSLLRGLCDPS